MPSLPLKQTVNNLIKSPPCTVTMYCYNVLVYHVLFCIFMKFPLLIFDMFFATFWLVKYFYGIGLYITFKQITVFTHIVILVSGVPAAYGVFCVGSRGPCPSALWFMLNVPPAPLDLT